MDADNPSLAAWLDKTVGYLVKQTADYLDTRELLMLVQAVAVMRLEQTLRELGRAPAPSPPPAAKAKGTRKD